MLFQFSEVKRLHGFRCYQDVRILHVPVVRFLCKDSSRLCVIILCVLMQDSCEGWFKKFSVLLSDIALTWTS